MHTKQPQYQIYGATKHSNLSTRGYGTDYGMRHWKITSQASSLKNGNKDVMAYEKK